MPDRATTLLIDRLRGLAMRKARFCYDVRGNSHVYDGIVASYNVEDRNAGTHELLPVLEHALLHDGMIMGVKDEASGKTLYSSCRHYTDLGNALRFAREQGRSGVYNWNRMQEVPVERSDTPPGATAIKTDRVPAGAIPVDNE